MREGVHELSLHGGGGLVDFVGEVVVEGELEKRASVGQALDHRIHEARVAEIPQTFQSVALQRVVTTVDNVVGGCGCGCGVRRRRRRAVVARVVRRRRFASDSVVFLGGASPETARIPLRTRTKRCRRRRRSVNGTLQG